MEFPCILVEITETTANRRLSERQRIKQNFDVQYFPGDESENRRKECEKVKQKMLRRFDVVSADGISFYVRNKNASIVDDVLHLLFLYRKDRLRRSLELKRARTEAGTTSRRMLV